MKKLLITMMAMIMAMFIISCGSDDDETCTDGEVTCEGNTLKWCVDGMLASANCEDDNKICSVEKKACIDEESSDTGTDADSGTTTDTGTDDNTDTSSDDDADTGTSTGDNCEAILSCMSGCNQDKTCMQNCFNAGSTQGQNDYNALAECAQTNCSSDNTVTCYTEKCPTQSEACGIKGGNTEYPAPYGTGTVNASFNYIVTNADSKLTEDMIVTSAFATGTLGSLDIANPPDAAVTYSYIYNGTDSSGTKYIQITQQSQSSSANLDTMTMMGIDESDATVGTLNVGLTSSDQATLYVAKVENNSMSCMYAFAIGTLTITSIDLTAGASGNFVATSSDIKWYSPANAPDYGGDITSQLNVTACPKQ